MADFLEFLVFLGQSGARLENAGFQGPNRFSGILGILAGLPGHRSPRRRRLRVRRRHYGTTADGRDIRAISANWRETSADAFNAHFSRLFSIMAICAISASHLRPGQRRRAAAAGTISRQGNRARRCERPWCGVKTRHRRNVRTKIGKVNNIVITSIHYYSSVTSTDQSAPGPATPAGPRVSHDSRRPSVIARIDRRWPGLAASSRWTCVQDARPDRVPGQL